MRTAKVVVLPYDKEWNIAFQEIKHELEQAVAELIIGIEHIGSTAVEGMSAKPCIDMDLVIRDHAAFDEGAARLAAIGYVHEGDLGISDREAFAYSNKPHLYKHHLYVCPQHSAELHRHVVFREFLKVTPEAVRQYSAVKEEAARLFPDDIDEYIRYKAPCIEELYRQCGLL